MNDISYLNIYTFDKTGLRNFYFQSSCVFNFDFSYDSVANPEGGSGVST